MADFVDLPEGSQLQRFRIDSMPWWCRRLPRSECGCHCKETVVASYGVGSDSAYHRLACPGCGHEWCEFREG